MSLTSRFRMLWRRLDRLHVCLVCFAAFLLVCFYHQDSLYVPRQPTLHPLQEYRYEVASKLVTYDKEVPLVWVGGVPRSGTTLARAMLDAHPDIRCGEETRVIPRILGIHSKVYGTSVEMQRLEEAHIDKALMNEAMAAYILTIIAGHGEPAPLLCNKDPFALRSMDEIISMFPNSKFILMIRDGRAVSHSIISRHVTIKGFDMTNYDGSLKDWNRAMASMWDSCRSQGAEKCLPVYYERLVLQPKFQMERILNFLNMRWNDSVLHHEQTVGKKGGISLSKKELSTDQVDKPVNQDALAKWEGVIPRNILDNIAIYAPMLSRLGYNTHLYPADYTKLLDPKAERTFDI